jgi:hypothetical protein
MTPYRSKNEFQKIFSNLWDQIVDAPEIVEKVAGENLVVMFRFTDFDTVLCVDTRPEPPRYFWDPAAEIACDVEMIQKSETGHKFWMEELNLPLALATRRIVAKGSVHKALKLIPALKPAFALYPQVLKNAGREDLLAERRKKRGWRLFRTAS